MRTNTLFYLRASLREFMDDGEAAAVARILCEDGLHLSQAAAIMRDLARVGSAERRLVDGWIGQLRAGRPVQYVLGCAMFCGHRFSVTPAVLIPRPETEDLVTLCADFINGTRACDGARVLDCGTGSGCIAVSIALACQSARVTAVDISADALSVARGNAASLGADVAFVEADLLGPLDEVTGEWDVIVSNPPYVMECERAAMDSHVLDHEPALALFVPDDDALRYYTALARHGRRLLRSGGRLFLEANAMLADATAAAVAAQGYEVEVVADRFEKRRFLVCSRNPNP